MRFNFRLTASLLLITGVFGGCDIIKDPVIQGPNGCTATQPTFTPRNNPPRKILLEEFTGHRCGNCPAGAAIIKNLETQYGEKLVSVAFHSEYLPTLTYPLNSGDKYRYDFLTPEAKHLDDKIKTYSIGIPSGAVNRKTVNGGKAVLSTGWTSVVSNIINTPPDMDIQVAPFYDPATQTVCAYAYTEALKNLQGDFRLVMYLTESHFVNWQKDYSLPDEDIEFYEHNHLFREVITTEEGVSLVNGSVTDGETFIEGYSIPFDNAKWIPENCYVVAFVYDYGTGEVVQAEMQKMVP